MERHLPHPNPVSRTKILFLYSFQGGLFFAKSMRENNYISMMDPYQRKYGRHLTAALAIVPVMSEVVWIASGLISLGKGLGPLVTLYYSCLFIMNSQ